MIFKKGDFVKVTTAVIDTYKEHLVGKIFKVRGESKSAKMAPVTSSGINNKTAYLVEGDPHYFYENELEMVAFPKEALENGMVVEYRDGSRRMVHNNELLIGDVKYNTLDMYWQDLTSIYEDDGKDIVKVYKSTACNFSEMWEDHTLELIWDRNRVEPKEMTLDQIEEILGYRVTIVD
jgi:hypothetical protein